MAGNGWAAVGQAASGILGGLVQRIGRGPKRQLKYSKKMFDYQAAYNHPKQQMARLREAGLNPNLVYGEGTKGTTGQQSGMDSIDFSQGGALQGVGEGISSGISSYMSTKQAQLKQEEQAIQNSLLMMDKTQKERISPSETQSAIASNELKTQQASFKRRVTDKILEDPKAIGYFADADILGKRIVKQRYLSNQIDYYIKDQTKAFVIKSIASKALMDSFGATLREQEANLKQAEVELFKKFPKSQVTNVITVLKMLLNK